MCIVSLSIVPNPCSSTALLKLASASWPSVSKAIMPDILPVTIAILFPAWPFENHTSSCPSDAIGVVVGA